MRIPKTVLRVGLSATRRAFESDRLPLTVQRRAVDLLSGSAPIPRGAEAFTTTIAGVPCEVLKPRDARHGAVMLFCHGGGYALGSARGYRSVAATLAAHIGATVVIPDYRLAPEHACPAALDDVIAVYRAITDSGTLQIGARGWAVDDIVIVGDSAGGGLTLALAQRIRDEGWFAPWAIGLISPWLDLTVDVAGTRPTRNDPLITPELIAKWCVRYIGDLPPSAPRLSPLFGGVEDLPPIIVHSAGDDPLARDAMELEDAFAELPDETGQLVHRVFPNLWHDFHLQAGFLAEADEAIADLGRRLDTVRGTICSEGS